MISLRWTVYREDARWVAQCLEYDMAVQSPTLHELRYAMDRTLVGHVAAARQSGLPAGALMASAPPIFRELWERGCPLELPECGQWQDDRGDTIPVPEIHARLVDRPKLA